MTHVLYQHLSLIASNSHQQFQKPDKTAFAIAHRIKIPYSLIFRYVMFDLPPYIYLFLVSYHSLYIIHYNLEALPRSGKSTLSSSIIYSLFHALQFKGISWNNLELNLRLTHSVSDLWSKDNKFLTKYCNLNLWLWRIWKRCQLWHIVLYYRVNE